MTRPDPPYALDGFAHRSGLEWRVREAADWRLVEGEKRCRAGASRKHTACRAPAVAELARRRRRYSGPSMDLDGTVAWWAYCADHMYGRWIESGRILEWIIRPAGEPT